MLNKNKVILNRIDNATHLVSKKTADLEYETIELRISFNAALSRISKLEEITEANKYIYETKLVKKE